MQSSSNALEALTQCANSSLFKMYATSRNRFGKYSETLSNVKTLMF